MRTLQNYTLLLLVRSNTHPTKSHTIVADAQQCAPDKTPIPLLLVHGHASFTVVAGSPWMATENGGYASSLFLTSADGASRF